MIQLIIEDEGIEIGKARIISLVDGIYTVELAVEHETGYVGMHSFQIDGYDSKKENVLGLIKKVLDHDPEILKNESFGGTATRPRRRIRRSMLRG